MRKSVFRFKKFVCMHAMSSMKIGVDAVLIGAWTRVEEAHTILDVGTGCGIIALMCAQRNSTAQIAAIDIDESSVEEASMNFNASPWRDRLTAIKRDFNSFADSSEKFDLIISNPPFFNSGLFRPNTSRLLARHESSLSPAELIRKGCHLLTPEGRLSMVVPYERVNTLINETEGNGLVITRACKVRGHSNAEYKRALLEFQFGKKSYIQWEELTLEENPNHPTPEYKQLCSSFYLYF